MPLFEGIISDLFPGTNWPNPDYGVLMDAVTENCKIRNLQATKWFLKKIIQVCSVQKWHFFVLCTAFIKVHYLTNGNDLFSLSIVFSRCLKHNQVIMGVVRMRRQERQKRQLKNISVTETSVVLTSLGS